MHPVDVNWKSIDDWAFFHDYTGFKGRHSKQIPFLLQLPGMWREREREFLD